jgi:hypothetical protein
MERGVQGFFWCQSLIHCLVSTHLGSLLGTFPGPSCAVEPLSTCILTQNGKNTGGRVKKRIFCESFTISDERNRDQELPMKHPSMTSDSCHWRLRLSEVVYP